MHSPVFKLLRERLGMTQAELGVELGMTQMNVSLYERGQSLKPEVAKKLIDLAASHGVVIDFNIIYGAVAWDAGVANAGS
jgi:putative transcriptional regulator